LFNSISDPEKLSAAMGDNTGPLESETKKMQGYFGMGADMYGCWKTELNHRESREMAGPSVCCPGAMMRTFGS
jgi:hypothetical protein